MTICRAILGLTVLMALETPLTSYAQTHAGPGPGGPGGVAAAIHQKQTVLLTQCPAPSSLPVQDAATLPIHVTEWGASGPKVLIIHGGVQGGLGGGPTTFANQKPLGDEGFQLEVVDRPGFGKSPSRGPDDMETDSIWIAKMLGDGSNLIGHSFGGAEALLAAARRPKTVYALVLIEPALQPLLMGDPAAGTPKVMANLQKIFGGIMTAKTPADYAIGFASNLGTASNGSGSTNEAAAALESNPDKAMTMGCALLRAHMATPHQLLEAASVVREAKIPVLIVTGGWSPAFDAVGEVAARLTGGQHVIVKSPNHFVQLSNPTDFNRVVASFMHDADAKHGPVSN